LGKALVDLLVADENNLVVGVSRTGHSGKSNNYLDVRVDLAKPKELEEKFDEIFPQGEYEEVMLINNAGWIGQVAPFGKLDPAGIAEIHLINTVAPALLMNKFVNRFGQSKGSKVVVNISSGAAEKDIDGWSGYSSSKAALNRYTGIAQEESKLHGWGIRFFALSPGIIDTPMQENIRQAKEENFSRVQDFKQYKANNDLMSPEEVAEKVLYLVRNQEEFPEVLQDVRKM